jgi:hypothetical protein
MQDTLYIQTEQIVHPHDNDLVPIYTEKSTISKTLQYAQVITLKPAFVNYFDFSSASVTTISQIDTWYKLNTNTTQGFSRNGLIHENNKITNIGEKSTFFLQAIVSIISGNNNNIHLAFFKNGVLVPCSEQDVTTSSGGKAQALPIQCAQELSKGDYIEVYVKNVSATTNVTIDNFNSLISEL